MVGDPSRRPSANRERINVDLSAIVWVECITCLGDGWHYPMVGGFLDRARKSRKVTCIYCGGLGARQMAAIQCPPGIPTVPPPKGWATQKS